jgi:hypothetical protein
MDLTRIGDALTSVEQGKGSFVCRVPLIPLFAQKCNYPPGDELVKGAITSTLEKSFMEGANCHLPVKDKILLQVWVLLIAHEHCATLTLTLNL